MRALRQAPENLRRLPCKAAALMVGMAFRPGSKADELEVAFRPRALQVFEPVGRAFKNVTPGEIGDRSHEESARKDTADRALISYEKAADSSPAVPD